MKKILLNMVVIIMLPLCAVLIIGPGCGPAPSPVATAPTCDTSATSKFMTLYNSFGTDIYGYDKQIYEYTFTSNINGSICAIGYQGHDSLSNEEAYKIEIIDLTTKMVLTTGAYRFSANARKYYNINSVAITSGKPYLVRRTVINNLGDVSNTVAHHKQLPNPYIPIIVGPLTINSTSTYDLYSSTTPYNMNHDVVLGCIDFVFN